ncbi:hypothetical protein EDD86DRAFT_65229 [Gorgonomyces haynaldii]|nr:hypothetical protein EDD86DRAFT_65229 [Gorgonomyces haynaldii]
MDTRTTAIAVGFVVLSLIWVNRQKHKPLTSQDDTLLIVHVSPQKTPWPHASPFSLKFLTFLQSNKVPYKIKQTTDFTKSPNGKIPFVEFRGKYYCDSHFLIKMLIKEGLADDPDAGMSLEDKARAEMIRHTVEHTLYWGVAKERWITDWENTKQEYFADIPYLFRDFVADYLILPHVLKTMDAIGITRYQPGQYDEILAQTIHSLAIILGSNKFFTGSQPRYIDYCVFAQLAPVYFFGELNKKAFFLLERHENLVGYVIRCKSVFQCVEIKPSDLVSQ